MPQDLHLLPNDFAHSHTLFLKEKNTLEKILVEMDVLIEHVGSTAVPGTIGKGIIDIIIACNTDQEQELIKAQLIEKGYRQGELNKDRDGRLFFCNSAHQTQAGDVHLHLILKKSHHYREVTDFRDHLLAHPEEVQKYNQEKLRLAQKTDHNRAQYVVEKTGFIQGILRQLKH